MKFVKRKLIILAMTALVGISLIISIWLLRIQEEDCVVYKRFVLKQRQSSSRRNFIDNRGAKFHIKQHGQYWILYNYLVAKNFYVGNESVSLSLHGEYTDLEALNALVRRWHGPISFTLFVNGDDFRRAENIILYMTKCTVFGSEILSFVTFNFMMHEDHIWSNIPKSEKDFMSRTTDCMSSPFILYNETYRRLKKLIYPSNMARNIARQTVSTYYVLSLDINYLPSAKFIENFLKMVYKLDLNNPFNTVYALTVFNAPMPKVVLPETKEELLEYYEKNKLYLSDESRRIPYIETWLKSSDELKPFSILHIRKHEAAWFPWYVSANEYEPFADDRLHHESFIDRSSHIDLLEVLGYDFAVTDNAFLLHLPSLNMTLNNSIFFQDERNVTNFTNLQHHRKLLTLRNFLMKFT
uniref:N-acetyllactosaminide beta-1,3-N-acetylglucosaminyltransferase n=1 Tax=Glossina palpalis gambiensis TaxID=67801 RepID=A0A1B0BQM1_9MUSC